MTMRKITGTDVKWIARGYWDNRFIWRVHPKAKPVATTSVVSLALLVILVLAATGAEGTPPALPAFTALAFLVFVTSSLRMAFIYLREREAFLDLAAQRWETEEEVPDRASLENFLDCDTMDRGLNITHQKEE